MALKLFAPKPENLGQSALGGRRVLALGASLAPLAHSALQGFDLQLSSVEQLAGVSADGDVIMGLYRKNAWQERVQHGKTREADSLGRYPRSRALTRNPKSQMV